MTVTRFQRLDKFMAESAIIASVTRAQELILGGYVSVNNVVITSPHCPVTSSHDIKIAGQEHPWVNEDGKILHTALDKAGLDLKGSIAIDIGVGSGGFSDVMLNQGTKRIYMMHDDSQKMHHSLSLNPRIKRIETANIQDIENLDEDNKPSILVYHSQNKKLSDAVTPFLNAMPSNAYTMAMINPELELELGEEVNDVITKKKIIRNCENWLRHEQGWLSKKNFEIELDNQVHYFILAQKR